MQDYANRLAETAQCFVNRVIDDLPEAMHQASRVRGSDVHAGTFADRFQSFKD
ncbi:hypothetical protein D3C74_472800 [compost metagenome]